MSIETKLVNLDKLEVPKGPYFVTNNKNDEG